MKQPRIDGNGTEQNMVNMRRLLLLIFFLCASFHHAAYAWAPFRGKTTEGKKVYLGPVPVQDTDAYQKFLLSSKSEIDKLYYLGDRVRAKPARGIAYLYGGSRFNWAEVYAGGMWYLWHHYERGKTARTFMRETSRRFERPGSRTTLELPDGSIHYAYDVAVNEMDLLEAAIAEENPNRGTR